MLPEPSSIENPVSMRLHATLFRFAHRHGTSHGGPDHGVIAQIYWVIFRVICFHLKCLETLYFQGFIGITVNQQASGFISVDLP